MMSSHGLNTIFFNKKNIDWSSGTLANPTLTPLRPIIYQYLIFVLPPPSPPHTHTHPATPPPQGGRYMFVAAYKKNVL